MARLHIFKTIGDLALSQSDTELILPIQAEIEVSIFDLTEVQS